MTKFLFIASIVSVFVILTASCSNSETKEKFQKLEAEQASKSTYTFVQKVEGHDYVIAVHRGCAIVHAESCWCKSK